MMWHLFSGYEGMVITHNFIWLRLGVKNGPSKLGYDILILQKKERKKRKENLLPYLKYRHEGGPVDLLLIMVFHDAA